MSQRRLAITTSRGLLGNIYLENGTISYSNPVVRDFAADILKHLPGEASAEEQFENLIGSDGFTNSEEITDGVVVNKLAPPLPRPNDPAHRDFSFPGLEEIEAMKEEILGNQDPKWRAKYGEASWEAAMALLGIQPSNVPADRA